MCHPLHPASMLNSAATESVHNIQPNAAAFMRQPVQSGGNSICMCGVNGTVPADMVRVARMLLRQSLLRPLFSIIQRTKTHRARMINKRICSQQMRPPRIHRTHAEIVLFPVAAPESRLIKRSNLIQRIAPDIHAKSNCGWNLHLPPGIRCINRAVQFSRRNVGR